MNNSNDKSRELSIDDLENVSGGTGETYDEDDDYVYVDGITGTGYFYCADCKGKFGGMPDDRNGTPCPNCGSTKTVSSETLLHV